MDEVRLQIVMRALELAGTAEQNAGLARLVAENQAASETAAHTALVVLCVAAAMLIAAVVCAAKEWIGEELCALFGLAAGMTVVVSLVCYAGASYEAKRPTAAVVEGLLK